MTAADSSLTNQVENDDSVGGHSIGEYTQPFNNSLKDFSVSRKIPRPNSFAWISEIQNIKHEADQLYAKVLNFVVTRQDPKCTRNRTLVSEGKNNVNKYCMMLWGLADAHLDLIKRIVSGDAYPRAIEGMITKTHINLFVTLMDPGW